MRAQSGVDGIIKFFNRLFATDRVMATASELEEVEAELRSCKSGCPPAEKLSRYLKIVREFKFRDSEPVARYGSLLLRHCRSSLSEEELWLVHEQVAVAAMDSASLPFAASLIKAVKRRFPTASRTRRLQGMYFEASGNLETAAEIYEDALKEKPGDDLITKRLVALEKTRGNTQAAIEALRKYLDIHAGDKDAWEELGELYLELLMYKQALFCYEELLLFQPANPQYLVKYADVLYSMGNFRVARSYYAKAIEASTGRSARALFGVIACFGNISEKVSLQDSKTRAQIELPDLSSQAIIKLYRKNAPEKLQLLEPLLRKHGLLGSQ